MMFGNRVFHGIGIKEQPCFANCKFLFGFQAKMCHSFAVFASVHPASG